MNQLYSCYIYEVAKQGFSFRVGSRGWSGGGGYQKSLFVIEVYLVARFTWGLYEHTDELGN